MKEGKLMKQINTKDYAESFGKIVAKCLQEGKYVGDWIWGNPAGQSGSLPTYEVHLGEDKIWCTSITWASASAGVENRKGVMATYPSNTNKTLGQVIEITIPYEFKRIYNTRAYTENNSYEIRSYGKYTVGRSGIKKQDFFDYIRGVDPTLIFIDEESKEYIKVFEYEETKSTSEFITQLIKYFKLVDTFKRTYR